MRMPREGKYWVARFHCVIRMDVECTHAYGDRSRCRHFEPTFHIQFSRFSARQREKIMDQLFRIPNHYIIMRLLLCGWDNPRCQRKASDRMHNTRRPNATTYDRNYGAWKLENGFHIFTHMRFVRAATRAWRRLSLIESDRITYLWNCL